ncbi:MAG: hypothetical protein LYZ69_02515 [Nitrososphaerales archaeon]|nr:hypothetical protein [Nitrososphaerales archaeon]
MPKKEEYRLGGACFVKLASLVELGRLSCALERAPFPLFAFKQTNGIRLAAQADLFMGTPVFYYIDTDKTGEFLAYRSSGDGEEVQLVGTASNPVYRYAPIIKVNKMPEQLKPRSSFEDTFISMEVQDLPSLAKVGTYKMLFEEPPLPLFAFKNGNGWVIGTFARIDDYEEASIFFYARTKDEPPSGFVKYAPDKIAETTFVVKADEPGFVPVKVIKLAEKHPLVEL